jgi:sirohydrochlorin cobaltochelatase
MVRKKILEQENIRIHDLDSALETMKNQDVSEVYIQSLHVIPGEEFHKIVETSGKYRAAFDILKIGRSLLTEHADYSDTIRALKEKLPPLSPRHAVVLMGHGSEHPADASYSKLQSILNDKDLNVLVGTVEGYPDLDTVISRLHARNITEVTLMPLMLVAGDHAQNDMAGDDDDSWKTILQKNNFTVHLYVHGLGENPAFQDIFAGHLTDVMD